MIEKNDIESIILKKLDGISTHEENTLIEEWLLDSKENEEIYSNIESIRKLFSRLNTMQQIDVNSARQQVKLQIEEFQKPTRFWVYLQRISAILFIPLILSIGIYFISKKHTSKENIASREIHTSYGVRTKFVLPDGTVVWLNSGSVLKYPEAFAGSKREVFLYGEAYFDVAKNEKSPFYVNLGELSVKATGTSFNIAAYPEENTFETTLITGHVNLIKNSIDNKEEVLFKLNPNQHAIYSKKVKNIKLGEEITQSETEKSAVKQTDKGNAPLNSEAQKFLDTENKYTSWIHGKLIFRNDSMDIVTKRLGRWYNADFVLEDTILYRFQYTATFTNETLEQVMELLSLCTPIEYSITRKNDGDDNSLSKELVTIHLRSSNTK